MSKTDSIGRGETTAPSFTETETPKNVVQNHRGDGAIAFDGSIGNAGRVEQRDPNPAEFEPAVIGVSQGIKPRRDTSVRSGNRAAKKRIVVVGPTLAAVLIVRIIKGVIVHIAHTTILRRKPRRVQGWRVDLLHLALMLTPQDQRKAAVGYCLQGLEG